MSRGRPMVLKRFVNGAEGEAFFQKRAPANRPDWLDSVVLSFPSGRVAEEIVISDAAGLAWVANLGCIDLNPHPIRAGDLDHPDELRVDLDPVPGVQWPQIVNVALVARDVLADFGLTGWPKTSGSRGMHVYARIEPKLDLHRSPPGRGGHGQGDRAPRAAGSDLAMVEGGAARRLRRLQPERQGPHCRLRLLGPPDAGRTGVGAAALGGSAGLRPGRVHYRHDAGQIRADRRSGCRHRRDGRVADAVARTRRIRPGGRAARRAVAAAFREAGGRGTARAALQAPGGGSRQQVRHVRAVRRTGPVGGSGGAAASAWQGQRPDRPAPHVHAADRGGPRREQGRSDGRPGPVAAAPPGCHRHARACRHPGRFDARQVLDLDQDPHQPAARATAGPATAGAA